EISFVYGQVQNQSTAALNLSTIMIHYWVSFANNLDPNDGKGSARPSWPQYTLNNRVILQLKGANTTVIPDNYRDKQIKLINSNPLL
ncbi:hypothetical protein M422DRAFT_122040, partial [Sphaerobolus stellatus SS14]